MDESILSQLAADFCAASVSEEKLHSSIPGEIGTSLIRSQILLSCTDCQYPNLSEKHAPPSTGAGPVFNPEPILSPFSTRAPFLLIIISLLSP